MPEDSVFEKARRKAFRLLSLRGRSTQELRLKLKERGFKDSVIGQVISDFADRKYLDDASFAREWARNLAVNRLYGNRRIEMSLWEKGISGELIKETIAAVREEIPETEALKILLKKKLKDRRLADLDRKEKSRVAQSLMARGFPAGKIFEVLGNKEGLIDDRE